MLTLSGELLSVARTQSRNIETGETKNQVALHVLHESKPGDLQLVKLNADPTVFDAWVKFLKKEISVPVRPWNMEGMAGLALIDKNALPTPLKV